MAKTCVSFVSQAAFVSGVKDRLGLAREVMPVTGTRKIGKRDMVRNAGTPRIDVDPETFAVKVDGVHATVKPAARIALNQLYFFS
jgi:urease subunit alpha